MYGQYQEDGRPEPRSATTYGVSSSRPAAKKGWKDEIIDFFTFEINHARRSLPEIAKRGLIREFCLTVQSEFLPHPNHSAVKIFERFLTTEENRYLLKTNIDDTHPIEGDIYQDILSMPEIRKAFDDRIASNSDQFEHINIDRNVGLIPKEIYILDILKDLEINCTRALLGTFLGSIYFYPKSNKYSAVISLRNDLNWKSATRFPKSAGGYETDPSKQISFCENVAGWETKMDFKIFIP